MHALFSILVHKEENICVSAQNAVRKTLAGIMGEKNNQ